MDFMIELLVCTDMCACNGDETCCDNVKRDVEESETSDSSESDTDDDSWTISFCVQIEFNI